MVLVSVSAGLGSSVGFLQIMDSRAMRDGGGISRRGGKSLAMPGGRRLTTARKGFDTFWVSWPPRMMAQRRRQLGKSAHLRLHTLVVRPSTVCLDSWHCPSAHPNFVLMQVGRYEVTRGEEGGQMVSGTQYSARMLQGHQHRFVLYTIWYHDAPFQRELVGPLIGDHHRLALRVQYRASLSATPGAAALHYNRATG